MSTKRKLLTLCLSAAALAVPLHASAQDGKDPCSQEVMMSYFPEMFVAQTLEKFDVPQAQRAAIVRGLEEKDKEVIPTIEEKAGKMNPNPLRDPQRRMEAVKLFRDTLLEMFASVMESQGIHDKQKIQEMLNDVQKQKAKQFATCMEQQERYNPSQKPMDPQGPGAEKDNRNSGGQSSANPNGKSSKKDSYGY